jgi:hypothetical protein
MQSLHKHSHRWLALLAFVFLPGVMSARFNTAYQAAPLAVAVATFSSDCSTAQSAFNLGGTVCAQVTGIDPPIANARFDFVDPDGIIQQRGPNITSDGQTATFPIPASGVNAKLGTWKVNIAYNSDSSVIASVNFTMTPACPALAISPTGPLSAQAGVAFMQALTGSGGTAPYTFSLASGAPGWLALSMSGTLSGTPPGPGSFNFTVNLADANACPQTQPYTLNVTCPAFSVSALPAGTAGAAYSQSLLASPAAGAPFSFALAGGSLPPGLSLANNGALTGIPTQAGSFNFSVGVTGVSGNCNNDVALTLTIACPVAALTPSFLPNGTLGLAYDQTLTVSPGGAAYSYAVTTGTLPPGLMLATNGALTGIPVQAGNFTFTVTATAFGTCTSARSYSVQILCSALTLSPVTLANGTLGSSYSQTVSGMPIGATYNYAVTSGALPAGLSLNATTGNIAGTPTTNGTSAFTITATSLGGCAGSQSYSVTINCTAISLLPMTLPGAQVGVVYDQTVSANPAGAYSYNLLTGSLPPGLNLNLATGQLSGLATTTGTYNFTLRAQGLGGCSGQQSYSLVISCPTVPLNPGNTTLPGGTAGTAYSQSFSASPSGNYSYVKTSGMLPPGLTLNSASGSLSGTPTTGGTFTFTISATGFGSCTGSQSYSLTITASCATITLPALPTIGTVGVNYNGNLAATTPSGSYTFTIDSGALPPGLAINSLFGLLSGKPTAAGVYNFTLKATRSNGCSGTRAYMVTVN